MYFLQSFFFDLFIFVLNIFVCKLQWFTGGLSTDFSPLPSLLRTDLCVSVLLLCSLTLYPSSSLYSLFQVQLFTICLFLFFTVTLGSRKVHESNTIRNILGQVNVNREATLVSYMFLNRLMLKVMSGATAESSEPKHKVRTLPQRVLILPK